MTIPCPDRPIDAFSERHYVPGVRDVATTTYRETIWKHAEDKTMKARIGSGSILAAIAMCVAVTLPATAGPPTFSGTLRCERASDGQLEDLNPVLHATNRDIAGWRKYWTSETGYCAPGSVDTSGLVQDP